MAVDHHIYVIKSNGRPQGSGSYGSPEDIKNMIAATQPGNVTAAAQVYDAMGNAIIDAQSALWDAAKVLADHWSGPAADSAQLALRRLYATAGELVVRSNETAKTLQWYGGSILPMYKSIKWPEKNTDSPAATAAADQVMRNLNERIAQTWDGMPPQVEKNLPKLSHPIDDIPDQEPNGGASGTRTGGRIQGSGVPGGRSASYFPSSRAGRSLPKYHNPPGRGTPSPGVPSPGPAPEGADLAGMHPVGGSQSGNGATGLGGGLPGSATGIGGTGLAPTGTGAPVGVDPVPSVRPLGLSGVIGNEYTAARSAEMSGRGPFSSGRSSGMNMPPTSGSGRSDEKERERTTWLSEDTDIWTGGEEGLGGLIGDAPNRVGERKWENNEILSIDELQGMLDLVDDTAGEESNATFNQNANVDLAKDPLSQIIDARFGEMAGETADPLATDVLGLDRTSRADPDFGHVGSHDIAHNRG